MPYAQLVEPHHMLAYANNVQMVTQQIKDPLRDAVTIIPGKGDSMRVTDLLGEKDYRRNPDRDRTNPDNPTKRSARWIVRPELIHDGEVIDRSDMFDLMFDPTSDLMRSTVIGIERGIMDSILGVYKQANGLFGLSGTGLLGRAMEGKRGTTQVPLPASQTIVNGGTGLTLAKLRTMKKRMRAANFGIDNDDQVYGYISPFQEDDLLAIAAQTGANLNTFNVEQLRDGKPGKLMGINWISTNRLPYNGVLNRMCPFWSKKNVIAAMWQDVQGQMWNDTSKLNLPYVYASAMADAVRVEDGGVFIIECIEVP